MWTRKNGAFGHGKMGYLDREKWLIWTQKNEVFGHKNILDCSYTYLTLPMVAPTGTMGSSGYVTATKASYASVR